MNGRILPLGGAALLGALLAAGTLAQNAEDSDAPIHSPPGTVLSDAEPLPPEDRDSNGAILLKHSPVRAQRQTAVDETGASVRAIGRGITQVLGGAPAAQQEKTDAQPQDASTK